MKKSNLLLGLLLFITSIVRSDIQNSAGFTKNIIYKDIKSSQLSPKTELSSMHIFRSIESKDKKVIRQWLRSKHDVDMINDQGQSLLHVAVQVGNQSLVKALLKRNIDVNIVDQHGKTALDYAVELHYKNIILILLKQNASVGVESHMVYIKDFLHKKKQLYKNLGWVFLAPAILFAVTIGVMAIAIPSIVTYMTLPVFLCGYIGLSLLGPFYTNIPSAGFFLASKKYQRLLDDNIVSIS